MYRKWSGLTGYVEVHLDKDGIKIEILSDGSIRATFANYQYYAHVRFQRLLEVAGVYNETSTGGLNVIVFSNRGIV